MKQTAWINSADWESQAVAGRSVGCVQAQPGGWTRDYLEQIQLVAWL